MLASAALRSLLVPTLLLGAGLAPAAAQDSTPQAEHKRGDHAADPDRAVQGGGAVPAGWAVRPDDPAGSANVKVVPMGKGIHVTLGPAIILYKKEHGGTGAFHTLATFTQSKKATHAEGYGLFYGGKALDGAGQKYTYFLVRQDGTYLVKRRDGDKTTAVTKGWVASSAVKKVDGTGGAANLLEIDAKRDASKVVFMVNGQAVHTMAATAADVNGVVGIRANHNLDLHIDGFDVHR